MKLIIKLSIIPIPFLIAIIQGFISFFFIKSQIINILPELNIQFINIFTIFSVVCIEITIISALYFGVKHINKSLKLGLILLLMSIPLFVVNYVLISKGTDLLVITLDEKETINNNISDSLNSKINNINNRILMYEEMINRNDTVSKRWTNIKLIRQNNDISIYQIKELQEEKKNLVLQLETKKQYLLSENDKNVKKYSTQYKNFAIGLIFISMFFNIASALLSNELSNDNKKENSKKDNESCTQSTKQVTTDVHEPINDVHICTSCVHKLNAIDIQDSNNKILELENMLIEQKNDFTLLIKMKNNFESLKRSKSKDKNLIIKQLEVKYLALKQKLGVNGDMEDKYVHDMYTDVHSKECDVHNDCEDVHECL